MKGEELRESFVGISALKASLNQNVESLLSGEVDHIVILRNNAPVGVMMSFAAYEGTKEALSAAYKYAKDVEMWLKADGHPAAPEPVAASEKAVALAESVAGKVRNLGSEPEDA